MIGFLSTILVFIVLDYLAETFLKNKGIDNYFRWHGSWYDIGNTTRGYQISFRTENEDFERPRYIFSLDIFRIHFTFFGSFGRKEKFNHESHYCFGFYSVDGEFPSQIIYAYGKEIYAYHFKNLPWAYDFVDTKYFNDSIKAWFSSKEVEDEYNLINNKDYVIIDRTYQSYITKSGKVQKTDVKGLLERRRWRRKIYKWFRIPMYLTRTSLDLHFNPSIGDKRDTWKGGVCSCSINVPNYKLEYPLYDEDGFQEYLNDMRVIKNKFEHFMINEKKY